MLNKCKHPFAHLKGSNTGTSNQQRSSGIQQRSTLTTQAEEVDDSVFSFGIHMVRADESVTVCGECDHINITLPTIRTKLNPTDIAIDNHQNKVESDRYCHRQPSRGPSSLLC